MAGDLIFREKRLHIRDIVDIDELTALFQSYSDITGMVTALLDLEGNVLIATNWQDSCTWFHRVNEVTSKRCNESDTALAGMLAEGAQYNVYQCRNGLVDIATPVIIDGHHMANFFTGQFFYQKPDLNYFSRQAEDMGFNKDAYLEAIDRVPVYDEETIQQHMAFLVRLAEIVGRMGLANLRTMQANEALEKHKADLQRQVDKRTIELKASLEAAEAANQAKTKFLTNMSHELRTPLNAVIGFSEILETKEQDNKKKGYLKSINLAGKGLLSLINSVLDLSRIESGKMPVQIQPMSLPLLLEEMTYIFTRQAAEKDLELVIDTQPLVPASIRFDETKLRQIIINLVNNAIKFTDRGHVTIRIAASQVNQTRHTFTLGLAIEDTGKGISESDQQRIFRAFEQSEHQQISDYGGTGIGLSLSHQLVELLGGELVLHSVPGKGSTFRCRFPEVEYIPEPKTSERALITPQDALNFSPATILIVDDNEINRDVLRTHLSEWNFTVYEAENGAQAIEMVKSVRFDLIFMDMKMPVMDGYEATRRLKSNPETRHIPVVAATASALVQQEKVIRELTDGYLSKPISRIKLVEELQRFIPLAAQGRQPLRALVVDDDQVNQYILSELLSDYEHLSVTVAGSGAEAVNRACCADERPDLIFIDYKMPDMDGITATQKIRDWEAEHGMAPVRIYAVSAFTPTDIEKMDRHSIFNGYLKKPIDSEEIDGLF